MATGFTTTNSLPPAVQQHLNLALLPWKQPQLIHGVCARKDLLPRKAGSTMRYRRYTKLQPFIAPMATDGTVPPPQSLSATDKLCVRIKSWVIDLEALWGDKAQAQAA